MQVVPDVIRALGYNPADILPATGIDAQLLSEPDALISFSSRVHLLRACAELTDCPDFGLRVGRKGGLSSFGLVGYLAMHSPSVGEALQNLIRHLHLHVQGAAVQALGTVVVSCGAVLARQGSHRLRQAITIGSGLLFVTADSHLIVRSLRARRHHRTPGVAWAGIAPAGTGQYKVLSIGRPRRHDRAGEGRRQQHRDPGLVLD